MTEPMRGFDAAGRRLNEAGVVRTSDELLDDGAHGLRFFREFLPLLAEWTGQELGFDRHVLERYDRLRGIDFGAFREDARLLDAVHRALLADYELINGEFRAALRTWEGEAAESAAASIDEHTGAGSAVLDELAAFGGAIPPVIDGIERAVREYARFVLDLAADMECAGRTPDGTRAEIRKARGDLQVADLARVDDVFTGAFSGYAPSAKDFIAGKGPVPGIPGAKKACDELRRNVVEEAAKWLDTAFEPELQAKLRQFEQQSVSTQECVQRAYDQLLSAVEISENPFRRVGVRPAEHTADSAAAGGEDRPAGTTPQSAESSPDGEPVRAGDGPVAGTGEPGPASTAPQSAGSDSMSDVGGSVQSTFADLSQRLFAGGLAPEQGLPEQGHSVPFGGPPPHSGAIGLATADQSGTGGSRGATGFASISEPEEARSEQQSAGSSAGTMGAGTMGAGMLGLGTMADDQAGDQERPAGDRRAEAWFDVAGPGTTPVFGEDRE